MAIAINGSGTITGLNAGGLPDDSITEASIADASVDEARLKISNSPTNGQVLSAQSGDTGGLTWATAASGGGKILQVVMGTLQGAFTSSSTSYTDTGLGASITPAATANKVLVTVHLGMVGTTTSRAAGFRLYREGSAVTGALGTSGTTENYTAFQYVQNANEANAGISFQYLDSPSSTSAQEYKVYVKRVMSDANSISINRLITTDAYGTISTITLMEVDG